MFIIKHYIPLNNVGIKLVKIKTYQKQKYGGIKLGLFNIISTQTC